MGGRTGYGEGKGGEGKVREGKGREGKGREGMDHDTQLMISSVLIQKTDSITKKKTREALKETYFACIIDYIVTAYYLSL